MQNACVCLVGNYIIPNNFQWHMTTNWQLPPPLLHLDDGTGDHEQIIVSSIGTTYE